MRLFRRKPVLAPIIEVKKEKTVDEIVAESITKGELSAFQKRLIKVKESNDALLSKMQGMKSAYATSTYVKSLGNIKLENIIQELEYNYKWLYEAYPEGEDNRSKDEAAGFLKAMSIVSSYIDKPVNNGN